MMRQGVRAPSCSRAGVSPSARCADSMVATPLGMNGALAGTNRRASHGTRAGAHGLSGWPGRVRSPPAGTPANGTGVARGALDGRRHVYAGCLNRAPVFPIRRFPPCPARGPRMPSIRPGVCGFDGEPTSAHNVRPSWKSPAVRNSTGAGGVTTSRARTRGNRDVLSMGCNNNNIENGVLAAYKENRLKLIFLDFHGIVEWNNAPSSSPVLIGQLGAEDVQRVHPVPPPAPSTRGVRSSWRRAPGRFMVKRLEAPARRRRREDGGPAEAGPGRRGTRGPRLQ
ncbi:hypothetical protein CYFUS_001228 [Cystobacter fuscus]|uniref:Uncharacterized protein n=1 Tax=Cystobacter fuscus TaxID=43 RepID=A0A250IVQ1_9BACT|nr:hypothetical protein CYFUS_001228 [Cystobacter fuscus]